MGAPGSRAVLYVESAVPDARAGGAAVDGSMLAVDVSAGVFLLWIGLRKQVIGGMSALWTAFIALFLMVIVGRILPEWVRQIIGLDFGILLCFAEEIHYYLSRMAKR